MERNMKMKMIAVVGIVMIVGMAVGEAAALPCGSVAHALAPCLPYLRSAGPLIGACCYGVTFINSHASTTADRRATCSCLKRLADASTGIKPGLAAGLLSKCHVSVPYKISPYTDCNKIN